MPSVPPRRVSRRHVAGLAAAFLIAALAVVPAVTAQGGDGDHQDTVDLCHFADGAYEAADAPESDFYGPDAQRHGRDGRDIVPPFVVENPRPDDPSSFDGRHWDDRGQAIFDAGCEETTPEPGGGEPGPNPEPERKVTICHATSADTNPYVSNEPAIANNGDLNGGHLDHTGPVYPAKDWGDIIPPYTYLDKNNQVQTFPGYNWGEAGIAIYKNGCEPPMPPNPKPVVPILECVEQLDGGKYLAHWGYDNKNLTTVEPPSGENEFSPGEPNRGQPKAFAAGRVEDAFQVEFNGSPLTWSLTGNSKTASSGSTRCRGGSITVTKRLVPKEDPGRFALRIGGEVAGGAEAVGDGGSTGTIAVATGSRTVSETGAGGTSLGDYTIETICRNDTEVVASSAESSVKVAVAPGDEIVCTITNNAKGRGVTPTLDCVLFKEGADDVAYWGYRNGTKDEVTIGAGSPANRFAPGKARRGQPDVFEPGIHAGVFQTPFQAGDDPLTWTLSESTATANADSPACNPTLELRKVTFPADDPGKFQLKINNAVVAEGGNGTTTGRLRIGIGEGTVSETAAPGTNLADYDSRVECTRNGVVDVSAQGTKVDGEVRRGDLVVCTFTNTRKGTPEPPNPPNPPNPPVPPTPPNPPPVPPPPPGPPPLLDLAVTKSVAPTTVGVGGRLTWTMTVTNRSSVAAADVNGLKLDDPRSYRTRLISLTATQGTCRPYTCNLGRLAPGASATVTAVTEAVRVGLVVDIVRVGSEEQESSYRNNVAAAVARVVGPLTPPLPAVRCRTLTAAPRVLQSRRSSVVRLTARNRLGKPLVNVVVRARGAGVRREARTDARGVARFAVSPERGGLVLFSSRGHATAAGGPVCRTLLGVLGASSTQVTG